MTYKNDNVPKRREVEYNKGQWMKYSNKWFPRYSKRHWVVWETETRGVCFFDFENAIIYNKLLELTSKTPKQTQPLKEENNRLA